LAKTKKEAHMMFTQKRGWVVGCFLFGFIILLLTCGPCGAQEKFPTKPITLIVGWGPGGSADLPARALAESASNILGQPVVVVNKPGGGGAVAYGELKNAKPDGYTVAVLAVAPIISAHLCKVTYDPIKDFDAIINFGVGQYGLAVRSESPFKSLKDLITYAQANPGKLKYGTAGAGTPQHLVMLQLAALEKIKWTNIPFGSGMEAVSALLGGHVDYISQSAEWKPYVLSGRLRLLAGYGNKRMDTFPDVPTLVELGYNVTVFAMNGLVAPKGVPMDRLKILHDAFYKGTDTAAFRKALEATDQRFLYMNSHDAQLRVKEIYEATGKIIKENPDEMK
jgi:tripartite-type tricarboxylate transporter receptor subunit TctC